MTILPYIETILAILIIIAILLQKSENGVGGAFGGSDSMGAYHTRRGFEKVLFNGTIILGILFVITSVLLLIIR